MEPEITPDNKKVTPLVLLIMLAGLLVVLVLVMWLVGNRSETGSESTTSTSTVSQETINALDTRVEVVERIQESSTEPLSDEEKRAILVQYGGDNIHNLNLSSEEKQLLLEALNGQ